MSRPSTSGFSPTRSQSRPGTNMSSLGRKSASLSDLGLNELPNLPGVKKDLSAINPKLYKEFKASLVPLDEGSITASLASRIPGETSLEDYFSDPGKYEILQKTLNPYPTFGTAFNDVYGGRYSICSQKRDVLSKSRSLPYCNLDSAPSFVKNADAALRFLAYFEETCIENGRETLKARTVEIVFHAEDNTLEITERKVGNCGITQGKILKRHQVEPYLPHVLCDCVSFPRATPLHPSFSFTSFTRILHALLVSSASMPCTLLANYSGLQA